jgi:hypothetical protein
MTVIRVFTIAIIMGAAGCAMESPHPAELGDARLMPEASPCDYAVTTPGVVDSQGFAANGPAPAPGCRVINAVLVAGSLETVWCCPNGGE